MKHIVAIILGLVACGCGSTMTAPTQQNQTHLEAPPPTTAPIASKVSASDPKVNDYPKLTIPFSFLETKFRDAVQQPAILSSLDMDVRTKSKGEAKATGLLFVGITPERSALGSEQFPVISVYIAAKIEGEADNRGYLLSRSEIRFSLNKGKIETKVSSHAADVRTYGPGFLNIFNHEGEMRETICQNLDSVVSPKIQQFLDEKLTRLASIQITEAVFHEREIQVTFGAAGTGSAKIGNDLPYGPVPFSGIQGTFVQTGFHSGDAAIVISAFADDLWFYRATLNKSGIGPVINTGKNDTLNKKNREDSSEPGRHSVVLYLPAGYVINNMDNTNEWLLNHNWNDHIRVIAIRPGPNYTGQTVTVYDDKNEGGKSAQLSVGDYPLTLDKYGLGDKVSSLVVGK